MNKVLCCLIVLVFSLGLAPHAPLAATPMPEFSLRSVTDGSMVESAEFKDKVVLVTFFATWCPPCMQEVPSLIRLHEDFGPRGFSVLGISVDEGGPRVVARLVKKRKINYPVVMADNKVIAAFGNIPGVPTSFLVNREGHVVKRYPGYVPHALLERDIEKVLGQAVAGAKKG